MIYFVIAGLIGFIAGLRSMMAPATVSLAAYLGWLSLNDTFLAFIGYAAAPYITILLAISELIVDKLPFTPSRKTLPGYAIRLTMGALCGAAITTAGGTALWSSTGLIGGVIGILGAILGTQGGFELRTRLARALGKDLPAALIEDLIAIVGAAIILWVVAQ